MNLKELQNLIAEGENERIELKASTGQRTQAAKTVCAMLNGLGGFVVFGVSDAGDIVGQNVSVRTMESIAAELRRIEPPAFPDISTVPLDNERTVIILTVSGGSGPYTYDGRPYLKHGPTTVIMPREEYERRIVERLYTTRRWENEPAAEGVTIDDLDAEEIHTTLDNAVRLGRLENPSRKDTVSILRGLDLVRDGSLLNAAVVLYGKSEHLKSLYPQMGLRLARFRGKDRLSDFSDNRQYWGHAFALLRRAESFLLDHIPIAGRVHPDRMIREDRPWYPPRAMREALAKALCHRDYVMPGGAVALAMYDEHLEITNPGEFHFGITPEKLAEPHESRPWNPIIANVFYRAGIIERWGMGALNIIDWCLENGNSKPVWAQKAGSVFVTFHPAHISGVKDNRSATGEVAGEVAGEVRRLLSVITGEMKRQEIQSRLDLKHEDHFRAVYLRPALDAGYVEMTIPDKPRSSKQKYRLTAKGKAALGR